MKLSHSRIAMLCIVAMSPRLFGDTWAPDNGGDWNSAESWTGDIPNGVTASATFGPSQPSGRFVAIDVGTEIALGQLNVSIPSRIGFRGDGSFSFSGQAEPTITAGGDRGSNVTIQIPTVLLGEAHRFRIDQDFSILSFDAPLAAMETVITKEGSGALAINGDVTNLSGRISVQQGRLDLNTGDVAIATIIQLNGGTLSTGSRATLSQPLDLALAGENRLTPNRNGVIELAAGTSGAGDLVLDGSGTIDVRAGLAHSGNVTIRDGVANLHVPSNHVGDTIVLGGVFAIAETGALTGGGAVEVRESGQLVVAREAGFSVPENHVVLRGGILGISQNLDLSLLVAPSSVNGIIALYDVLDFDAGGTNVIDLSLSGTGTRLASRGNSSIAPETQLIPEMDGVLRLGGLEGNLDVSASIADGVGSTSLEQAIRGTTQLLVGNAYSGLTTVRGGSLVVEHPDALGNPATGTVVEGGTLVMNVATPEPITVSGDGTLEVNATGDISGPLIISGGAVSLGSFAGQITMSGGELRVEPGGSPFDLPLPLMLAGGTSTVRFPDQPQRTFAFDVRGAGDLRVDITGGATLTMDDQSNWMQNGSVIYSGPVNATVELNGPLDYSGTTTIEGPRVHLNHEDGLGRGETTIAAGTLVLNVPTESPLHVTGGGVLELTEQSAGRVTSIAMSGGDFFPVPERTLSMPIELRRGDGVGTIHARSNVLAGGSSGTGDLKWIGNWSDNNIDGLPLAHDGELQIEGYVGLNTANQHTGRTIISGGETTLNHPRGLGVSSTPARVERSGQLLLNVAPQNDMVVENATVELRESASDFTGTITLANPTFFTTPSDLRVMGEFHGTVNASSPTGSVLRGGQYHGQIVGDGDVVFFSDLPGHDVVELHSANSYSGLTRVSVGTVDVNHADALGTPDVGTIVERGTLNVNRPTRDALLLQDYGTINLYEQLARLPISMSGSRGNIVIHVPSEYSEPVDLFDATLRIHEDTTLSTLTFWGDSGVVVEPGKTLRFSSDSLDILGGRIQGNFETEGTLRKYGSGIAQLDAVTGFAGDVEVHRGILEAQPTPIGVESSSIRLESDRFASIEVKAEQTLRYGYDLYLNNANGYSDRAGLHVRDGFFENTARLTGKLDVGDVGSTIGAGQSAELEITGEVTGGSLSIVEGLTVRLQSLADQLGEIQIRHGTLSLSDASGLGAMQSGGKIHVHPQGHLYSTHARTFDRFHDAGEIVIDGGSINMYSSSATPPTENIGPLVLNSGATEIATDNTRVVFQSLSHDPDATALFALRENGSIHFVQPPPLENGIIGGWALLRDDSSRSEGLATIGPDGLTILDEYHTDVIQARANHNLLLDANAQATTDIHINSLTSNGDVTMDLQGHLLTLESGALLSRVVNGRVTAGVTHPILYGFGSLENVDIVDNGDVSVSLVVPGGYLGGNNSYTGATVANRGTLTLASPTAIPPNSDLILVGSDLWVEDAPGEAVPLKSFVLRGGAETHQRGAFIVFDADLIQLEEGTIGSGVEFVGDGTLVKESVGEVWIDSPLPNFTGQVVVRDGLLRARSLGTAQIRVEGGVFSSWWNADGPMDNVIDLEGGALAVQDEGFGGPIHVLAPSTIINEGGELSGQLHGAEPIVFESVLNSNEAWSTVSGDNSGYSGEVSVNSGTVRVESTLGSGPITINRGGRVELATENTENDFLLSSGSLLSYHHMSANVLGNVRVETTAFVGAELSGRDLALLGGVELADQSRLYKIGDAGLSIQGEIGVAGKATMVIPSGQAELAGVLVPRTDEATLDIVGLGFETLHVSLEVPEGARLNIEQNGFLAPVKIVEEAFAAGNGVIANDIVVADGGIVRPGESVGVLTVAGDVVLSSNSRFEWEINTANATQGAANGKGADLLMVNDQLAINASTDQPIVLHLSSLDPTTGVAGAMLADFDARGDYHWTFAVAEEITGFEADRFEVDASQFAAGNPLAPGVHFEVVLDQASLALRYDGSTTIDFDNDGTVTVGDIDLLIGGISANDTRFDVTRDGLVDADDITHWLTEAGYYLGFDQPLRAGDANLDGMVGPADLNVVGIHWLQAQNAWSRGDFNGDGTVDPGDLNKIGLNWSPAPVGETVVPEPGWHAWSLLLFWFFLTRRPVTFDRNPTRSF